MSEISAPKYYENDKIKMILNIPNKTLEFYQNENFVYKFIDIDVFAQYRLGISIYSRDDCIRIINFKITKQKQNKSVMTVHFDYQ